MYRIFFIVAYCVSANLSFYRTFLLFYLCMFMCILCIVFDYLLPFSVINDDDDDDELMMMIISLLDDRDYMQAA